MATGNPQMGMCSSSRLAQVILTFVVGCSGCVYVSDYVPPNDGRARVIWRDNKMIPVLSGGQIKGDECGVAIANLSRLPYVAFKYHDKNYPEETGYMYKDWITLAKADFLMPTLTYHVRRVHNWRPTVYFTGENLNQKAIESGQVPLFDSRLHESTDTKNQPGLDEISTTDLLIQRYTVEPFGYFTKSSIAFPDSFAQSVTWFFLNLATTALTPFIGITGIFPAINAVGSTEEINRASNLVNAFNDLARTEDSPCAYPTPSSLK